MTHEPYFLYNNFTKIEQFFNKLISQDFTKKNLLIFIKNDDFFLHHNFPFIFQKFINTVVHALLWTNRDKYFYIEDELKKTQDYINDMTNLHYFLIISIDVDTFAKNKIGTELLIDPLDQIDLSNINNRETKVSLLKIQEFIGFLKKAHLEILNSESVIKYLENIVNYCTFHYY